ncbi:MAG: DUF1573 domain-containing protein [Cytophagales bacterium]|nr:MAG: DUF1573 domain-containing protein [Cytophagales bacterium]TAF61219.1 MAG: DUF1573 domain-containing protein [Cytophagales bacterium]
MRFLIPIFTLLHLTALVLCSSLVLAQNTSLNFNPSVFDFGKIDYADTLKAIFEYQTQGEGRIIIKTIKPECACTSTSLEANPNEKGVSKLEVLYLPYEFGSFDKKLEITYILQQNGSSEEKTKTLRVKGYINPPISITERFRFQLGPLMTKSRLLNFGTITTEKALTKKFELHNPSKQAFNFKAVIKTPSHIRVQFDNKLGIDPEGSLALFVTYWPDQKKDYGSVLDTFWIYPTNDMNSQPLPIMVSANIEQHFPNAHAADGYKDYPQLLMVDSIVDLGDVYSQDTLIAKFVLYNKSPKNLEIYKIVAGYGCKLYSVFQAPYTLSPNESAVLEVHVLKDKMKGKLSRSVTLYCNDPRNHVKLLKVYANLK